MPRHVALLRAINLGATRKVPMPRLRELLAADGFTDVTTYLQSGNVMLDSPDPAPTVATRIAALLEAEFGFSVPTVVRTRVQLAKVVATDPIPGAAADPKRYQVTFLERPVAPEAWSSVDPGAWGESTFVAAPSELFTHSPDGIRTDPMLRALAKAHAGVEGTARNWTTVTKLLELLDED